MVQASLDTQRSCRTQPREFADSDARPQRAGAQFVAQRLVTVARDRLQIPHDRKVHDRRAQRIHIGDAQHPVVADPRRAHRIQLGTERKAPEREQYAQHQAERHAESQIFRQQVGEHTPHHADRPTLADHEIEQPQHPVEEQQHRCHRYRGEQRHRDPAREISIERGEQL
jgi:hypothetical protein